MYLTSANVFKENYEAKILYIKFYIKLTESSYIPVKIENNQI